MNPFLVYTNKARGVNYLVTLDGLTCFYCPKVIERDCFVHSAYNADKKGKVSVVCRKCVHKVRLVSDQDEVLHCVITSEVPSGVEPHPLVPSSLSWAKGDLTVFGAAEVQLAQERVVDRTVLASRSDRCLPLKGGVRLLEVKRKELERLDRELDKSLSVSGAAGFLSSLKKSVVIDKDDGGVA